MAIQFSLAQHTVPTWSPAEMIYNAYQIGYDMVGIRMIRQGIAGEADYDMVRNPYLAELAREALDRTGIQLHDIDLATIGAGHAVADYAPYLELAGKLGAQGVVSSIWTEDSEVYLKEFSNLCDLASTYHLEVYLEFVTWAGVRNLKQAKHILETVHRPNAKVLLDSLHYYRSLVSPEELEQCPREWFGLIHLCDAPAQIPDTIDELASTARTQRLYPGEGIIDSIQIIRNMPTDKVIGVEIPNDRRRADYGTYEHARRALEYSKAYLQRNGML